MEEMRAKLAGMPPHGAPMPKGGVPMPGMPRPRQDDGKSEPPASGEAEPVTVARSEGGPQRRSAGGRRPPSGLFE
jgi:hypothetical protein